MAKEYIEREAAKARLRIWITDCVLAGDNDEADCYRDCIDLLDSIPTADVVEVRHGRWEKQSGLYSCSECGMTCPYDVQADVIEYWACNHCPNCGAKIDKEEE